MLEQNETYKSAGAFYTYQDLQINRSTVKPLLSTDQIVKKKQHCSRLLALERRYFPKSAEVHSSRIHLLYRARLITCQRLSCGIQYAGQPKMLGVTYPR